MAGTAYLVGAGPGDPALITVRGKELIEKADCIIYDRLAAPELLDSAKPDCEIIYVGKENRHHVMRQDEINRLIAEKALQYDVVVRLKGGDPYVFGRGGEEALFLEENNVDFEVVPGISSSVAGPAYAGIPVTHRGLSLGFRVVTAHDSRDMLSNIDFDSIANSNETCVFLMSLGSVGKIAEKLMLAGMNKDAKAAVVSNAATAKQKVCVAPLKDLESAVKKAQLESPALIVTGNVVALHDKLDFFEKRPLFGRRYLVPKIGAGVSELAKMLRTEGAFVEEVTVGKIAYKIGAFTIRDISAASWIVFTSRNGVNGFFANIKAMKKDVRVIANAKIAAIGSETKRALRTYGIAADLVPDEYNSDALCKALSGAVGREDVIFYPKAANADDHIKKALKDKCSVIEAQVYENSAIENTGFDLDYVKSCDAMFFTCGSSLQRMAKALKGKFPAGCALITIGPKCSKTAELLGLAGCIQAEKSTYRGMVDAAKKIV